MEEIDLLELEKELKRKETIKYLKSKEGLLKTSASLISFVPIILNDNIYLDLLFTCNSIINFYSLFKSISDKRNNVFLLNETITNSNEYHECIELYNSFIKDLAIFLKSFGFKDSKYLNMFLLFMLETGMLSKEKKEYHKFKYGSDILIDDFGIRVFTGKTVCRHTSHFFTDVLNTCGYTACNYSVYHFNLEKLKKSIAVKPVFNHMVNCVLDNDKKYLFDTTSYGFSGFCDDVTLNDYEIAFSLLDDSYYAIAKNNILFNKKYEKQLAAMDSYSFEKLDKDEIKDISAEVLPMVLGNMNMLTAFNQSNKDRIERLAYLIQKLSPLSDEPIKKWQIK